MLFRSGLDAEFRDRSIAQPAHDIARAPIDRKHLARYTFGDIALELEVLGLFVCQMPDTIRALKAAASEKDWLMAAHTLKGSSRAVGAWRLADLAQEAENTRGDRKAAAGIVRQIDAAAADIARYIEALMQPDAD